MLASSGAALLEAVVDTNESPLKPDQLKASSRTAANGIYIRTPCRRPAGRSGGHDSPFATHFCDYVLRDGLHDADHNKFYDLTATPSRQGLAQRKGDRRRMTDFPLAKIKPVWMRQPCFSSGKGSIPSAGGSDSTCAALRSAVFSSFFRCFSSILARDALARSDRSLP
jgi:hypothetical protein